MLFFSSCFSGLLFFYRTGKARIILGIESTITGIASCIYHFYIYKMESGDVNFDLFNKIRYLDWVITTPLMLLSISYVFSKNLNIPLPIPTTLGVIFLDLIMLAFGYAGEVNWLEKEKAQFLGFIPFILMFSILYKTYRPRNHIGNSYLFLFYFILWTIYGLIYVLPESEKNNAYAIMDCLSKAIVSLCISYFL